MLLGRGPSGPVACFVVWRRKSVSGYVKLVMCQWTARIHSIVLVWLVYILTMSIILR